MSDDWGEPVDPQYGAPQYGAPQYGAPQYGAPQYGPPQYGPPQYGPPAPRPNRGGLIALVVAIAVVVAAGITALVVGSGGSATPALRVGGQGLGAPGPGGPTAFPSSGAAAPSLPPATSLPTTLPSGVPSISLPTNVPSIGGGLGEATATLAGIQFLTTLSSHQVAAVQALACPGTQLGLTRARLAGISAALPSGPAAVSGASATVRGNVIRTDGTQSDVVVYLRQQASATWCVTRASGL